MGLVLCIPIVRPRRIESSNQMRFRNIRPPRVRVDFQPRSKRITTLSMRRANTEKEQKKVEKNKKNTRVNEDQK